MAHCGSGINREELLDLMNIVMLERKDPREYVLATMKTIDGLIKDMNISGTLIEMHHL